MKKLLSATIVTLGLLSSVAAIAAPLPETSTPQPTVSTTLPVVNNDAITTKKPRSEAQLKNDQIMRDCGAKFRAEKAKGTVFAPSVNGAWVDFLKTCRAANKI